jgi:hypothetical protein
MTINWDSDELSAAEARRAARKRALSRAWIDPPVAPWRAANQPKYWYEKPEDPVSVITTPAPQNSRKGAGPTPEEIAEIRAKEREEFAERLRERWQWNVNHL